MSGINILNGSLELLPSTVKYSTSVAGNSDACPPMWDRLHHNELVPVRWHQIVEAKLCWADNMGMSLEDWRNHNTAVLKTYPDPSVLVWEDEGSTQIHVVSMTTKYAVQDREWHHTVEASDPDASEKLAGAIALALASASLSVVQKIYEEQRQANLERERRNAVAARWWNTMADNLRRANEHVSQRQKLNELARTVARDGIHPPLHMREAIAMEVASRIASLTARPDDYSAIMDEIAFKLINVVERDGDLHDKINLISSSAGAGSKNALHTTWASAYVHLAVEALLLRKGGFVQVAMGIEEAMERLIKRGL